MQTSHARWAIPLILMLLLTPFTPWLDLSIARFFYHPQTGFSTSPFFQLIYTYGIIPGWILAIGAMITLTLSHLSSRFIHYKIPSFFLVLTLALGAGLIVHSVLKDHWGRPRPKQVIEFGGAQEFRPYYSPNFGTHSEKLASFSCGHCSMGFYFFALALLGARYKKTGIARTGFFLAFLLGGLLSLARIAQGGHFFSDTLFSGLIMWETAVFLDWFLFEKCA